MTTTPLSRSAWLAGLVAGLGAGTPALAQTAPARGEPSSAPAGHALARLGWPLRALPPQPEVVRA
jgi:hypothetical protein